jgi:hypothetical protein
MGIDCCCPCLYKSQFRSFSLIRGVGIFMVSNQLSHQVIEDFEKLVDELMRPNPNESDVKQLMEKLGLEYEREPVQRISQVLERMNQLVFDKNKEREDYDLR